MAGNRNVSSLINSSTNDTLSKVEKVKSFGDQIPDDKKNKLKSSSLGKEADLRLQILNTTGKIIELDVTHAINKKDLQIQQQQSSQKIYNFYFPSPPAKPPVDNEIQYEKKSQELNEEFAKLFLKEEENYRKEKELLEKQKADLQQKLEDILNDPYKRVKKQRERRKKRVRQRRQRNKNKGEKEKKRLSLKVLRQAAKTIAPIVSLYGTKLLFSIVTTNKRIQDLIDDTNAIIEAATTKQAIENARVIRNSTLSAINENERKLESLRKLIANINRVITLLNLVLSIIILIFTIPKPFGLGPTMPTPVANRVKKLQDIIFALNITLSILQGILDAKLDDLRDLRSQLLNINNILDNVTLNNLSDDELQDFINNLQTQSSLINSTTFPEYKGFKFQIKEEETIGNQQAIVIRGNIKRRYAVAINKSGVEILKSELSFTLDPPDLIEQLKIIIDQQNLQA
jgi:hypothetical protein